MYHFSKNDINGNKVPLMSISDKSVADEFMAHNRHLITRVLDVQRNRQPLILM